MERQEWMFCSHSIQCSVTLCSWLEWREHLRTFVHRTWCNHVPIHPLLSGSLSDQVVSHTHRSLTIWREERTLTWTRTLTSTRTHTLSQGMSGECGKNLHFVARNEWWVWDVDLWFELETIFTCTDSNARNGSFLQLPIHANLVFTFISGYWTLDGRLCGQEDKYQALYHQVGFWFREEEGRKQVISCWRILCFHHFNFLMNRTTEFRQVLSDCSNLSTPSDPRIKSGKYSTLLVKKPKSLKTEWINFNVSLRRLVKTITQMRVFLIQNRKDYINI